jgi:hypothetical protein
MLLVIYPIDKVLMYPKEIPLDSGRSAMVIHCNITPESQLEGASCQSPAALKS